MLSKRIEILGSWLALAAALSACSRTTNRDTGAAALNAAPTNQNGTVGILSVNQVLLAMTNVTNLSPATTMVPASTGGTQSLAAQYTSIAPFMSATGNISTVNSSMLLALTGLAGSVCGAWLSNEAAAEASKAGSSLGNGGVPFKSGPAAITPAIASLVVNQYAQLFWGRLPTSDEAGILTDSISEAAAAAKDTGTTGAQEVLLVPCTAMLASPAFLAS